MLDSQAKTIFVELNTSVFNEMIEESTKWYGKETGGMMFGKINEKDTSLMIRIEKTHIPPIEACVRNTAYFEINPEYARSILDSEKLLYLGNWHKHLGYGGPSYGDHQQIGEFFNLNPHKNTAVSLIIDLPSEDNHTVIVEVYQRKNNLEVETENNFHIVRVAKKNISYYSEEEIGITKELMDIIRQELIQVYRAKFKPEDIHQFKGLDEKIISFPHKVVIDIEEENKSLELLVLISFPPEFPDGQIYIDLSSQDLSRRFTIEKHPASVLYEEELIQPFLELLKATLEERIPQLMKEPFWKIMKK